VISHPNPAAVKNMTMPYTAPGTAIRGLSRNAGLSATVIPDFALVAGVPARRIKWVGRAGVPLVEDTEAAEAAGDTSDSRDTGSTGGTGERNGGGLTPAGRRWVCPNTGARYIEIDETLSEVTP
jgi:hypothetical protein